jgi:hypothetical protein
MSFPVVINASFSQREHAADTADRYHDIGQRMEYEDGRKFRYTLNGGTLLVASDLVQGKIHLAGDDNLGVDATADVGDTAVTFTSATSTAVNYYNDGWMGVTLTPGDGYVYKILTSPVLTSGSGDIITLHADDPIRVALTASSEIGLIPNRWNGVIQAIQTTLTAPLAGVACTPITASQYGWLQTGGVACVQGAGSEVLGNTVVATLAQAGRTGVPVGTDLDEMVGIVLTITGSSGQDQIVDLRID